MEREHIDIARHWRLRKQRLRFVGERCLHCDEVAFPSRSIPPEKVIKPRKPRFGTVIEATEIGTRHNKREFVIKVNLDSGFEDEQSKNKFLYLGDIQLGCRVEIDEIKAGNGVITTSKIIGLTNEKTQDNLTTSLPLRIPEASMSSKLPGCT